MARPNARLRRRNAARGDSKHFINHLAVDPDGVTPGTAFAVLMHAALRICDAYGLPGGTLTVQ
jgi:hypothetical protein